MKGKLKMTSEPNANLGVEKCRQILLDVLEKATPGDTLSHGELTIIPLKVGNGHALPYLMLSDAIEAGVLEITEVDEGGDVPHLKVTNTSDQPVLILSGDELIGAKQNRIVNVSMIVPGNRSLVMPVSCVEQGRWAYRSRRFSSGRKASSKLRRSLTRSVRQNVRDRGEYRSDQGRVWDEVGELQACHCCDSPTAAMSDTYEHVDDRLSEFREKMPCPDEATGFAAFIGGRLVGLEVFEHPEILRKIWASHVESYAIDSIAPPHQEPAGKPEPEQITACTRRITGSIEEPRPSVGEGYDVGVEEGDLVGAALVNEGRLVHLQAFVGQ
jgi:hypothetical protein